MVSPFCLNYMANSGFRTDLAAERDNMHGVIVLLKLRDKFRSPHRRSHWAKFGFCTDLATVRENRHGLSF